MLGPGREIYEFLSLIVAFVRPVGDLALLVVIVAFYPDTGPTGCFFALLDDGTMFLSEKVALLLP